MEPGFADTIERSLTFEVRFVVEKTAVLFKTVVISNKSLNVRKSKLHMLGIEINGETFPFILISPPK